MDLNRSGKAFTAHWLTDAEMPLANKFYRAHKFRGKARRHDPCMVVRDAQKQIIACGSLRKLTDSQLLAGVAVAEESRGKGVARFLLRHMAEAYDDSTFTFPYRHLVPFYESLGYTEVDENGLPSAIVDRFHTYQKQGRDILIMRYQAAH
ncbi:GNAT family N-acetyltransferase [Microbulbifer agarilyticus]|uniref:GNAT family N-acetyltransferase n=1 Tax=Microbulbifer agarilyticus TaxID=260552 RepID=UPI001CD665C5|nr:GNAT family N-acetyltransferase [Microbulbifer agarilyticus]MCA0901491.1 GNAT family N-acetyltransferase [Microbulbifer agarilyticus]